MKLNKFCILFAAMFALVPRLAHPFRPFINAIVRIETFAKNGKKIHLLGDHHDKVCVSQEKAIEEKAIIEGLAQQKDSHVYVEDALAHSGDKKVENSLGQIFLTVAREQATDILGLTHRLNKAGIPASSVECRVGIWIAKGELKSESKISNQEFINDYKNIVASLERSLPDNGMGAAAGSIIKQIKEREKQSLVDLEQNKTSNVSPMLGAETVDMLALTKLCDAKAPEHVAFIGGNAHCGDIALLLENKLGYERINCVETSPVRAISSTYEPFLSPAQRDSHVIVDACTMTTKSKLPLPKKPLSAKQIKEYFRQPSKEDYELNLEGLRLNRKTGRVEQIAAQ